MFKVEDILARLHNGEDTKTIADEMVNTLNNAIDQFQKEEEAKEKAKEHKAHLKETQKLKDLQEIIDLTHDFCIEYYCDSDEDINVIHEAFEELDAKSVNKLLNEIGIYAVKLAEMEKHFGNMFGGLFGAPTVKKVSKKPNPETRTADAVISDFLSSMGLK